MKLKTTFLLVGGLLICLLASAYTLIRKERESILGTYVFHKKDGFVYLELKTNSQINYISYIDYEKNLPKEAFQEVKESPLSGQPFVFRSNGNWGLGKDSVVVVHVKKYQYKYRLEPTGLVEFDESGDLKVFKKVLEKY